MGRKVMIFIAGFGSDDHRGDSDLPTVGGGGCAV